MKFHIKTIVFVYLTIKSALVFSDCGMNRLSSLQVESCIPKTICDRGTGDDGIKLIHQKKIRKSSEYPSLYIDSHYFEYHEDSTLQFKIEFPYVSNSDTKTCYYDNDDCTFILNITDQKAYLFIKKSQRLFPLDLSPNAEYDLSVAPQPEQQLYAITALNKGSLIKGGIKQLPPIEKQGTHDTNTYKTTKMRVIPLPEEHWRVLHNEAIKNQDSSWSIDYEYMLSLKKTYKDKQVARQVKITAYYCIPPALDIKEPTAHFLFSLNLSEDIIDFCITPDSEYLYTVTSVARKNKTKITLRPLRTGIKLTDCESSPPIRWLEMCPTGNHIIGWSKQHISLYDLHPIPDKASRRRCDSDNPDIYLLSLESTERSTQEKRHNKFKERYDTSGSVQYFSSAGDVNQSASYHEDTLTSDPTASKPGCTYISSQKMSNNLKLITFAPPDFHLSEHPHDKQTSYFFAYSEKDNSLELYSIAPTLSTIKRFLNKLVF